MIEENNNTSSSKKQTASYVGTMTDLISEITIDESEFDNDEEIQKDLINLNEFSPEELSHFEEVVKKNEDFHEIEERRLMRLREDYSNLLQTRSYVKTEASVCGICQCRFIPLLRPATICQQCALVVCSKHIYITLEDKVPICSLCKTDSEFLAKSGAWFDDFKLQFSKDEEKPPSIILKMSLSAHQEIKRVEELHEKDSSVKTESEPSEVASKKKGILKFRGKAKTNKKKKASIDETKISSSIITEEEETTVDNIEIAESSQIKGSKISRPQVSSFKSVPIPTRDTRHYSLLPDNLPLADRANSVILPPTYKKGPQSITSSHKGRLKSLRKTSSVQNMSTRDDDDEEDINDILSVRSKSRSLSKRDSISRDSLASFMSDESFGREVPISGEISIALDFDFKKDRFLIYVKECKNLTPIDHKKRTSNPYVKTLLLPDQTANCKRKTSVKFGTIKPVYNEALVYVINYTDLHTRTLNVSVWHHETLGYNMFLGECKIRLSNWNFDDISPRWYVLSEKKPLTVPVPLLLYRGDIVMSIKFELKSTKKLSSINENTAVGDLHVWIKESRNLVMNDKNSFCPYTTMILLPEKSKGYKRKTHTIRGVASPRWNVIVHYHNVTLSDLRSSCLQVQVKNFVTLAKNEFIGCVRLNVGPNQNGKDSSNVPWMDAKGHEAILWQNMLKKPNCWVEGTLMLRSSLKTW